MAKIPPVTKISPRLIRILGCNPGPMTLQGTNTYLIGSGQRRILVDTGDANVPEYVRNIKSTLFDERILINDIIISHWHHDHIGGVNDVLNVIENRDTCKVWKFPRVDATETVPNINLLQDGQKFVVDGATLEVLHTPGHTTDHIILLLHEENSIFSGDCILGEGTSVFEDLHSYMNSLQKILSMKPTVIYPGHGNIIQDPEERLRHYIDHRKQREAQIMTVFKQQPNLRFSEMDLVKIIYKDTPKNLWVAAAINVNHHLRKLTIEKKIIQEGDFWMFINKAASL
ncbi:beta-lactamase-like protein 2 homolog [Malaya genurostris]|uniref:beta-lactamase-like protein 2 homolog n=1 Tax=Malaya genurostris TaxID=325434 RepID=UPI0026F3B805|nr:beta-lactamase-like protein 2 homolog [Malaya genurostris]XP_058468209.1 beta-lactamase-like protein 2 homolog [Malaya genurostris]